MNKLLGSRRPDRNKKERIQCKIYEQEYLQIFYQSVHKSYNEVYGHFSLLILCPK